VSAYDFNAQRLYVEAPLITGASVEPTPAAQNYLLNVLRLREGDALLLFNGRDGEWRATIAMATRRAAKLIVNEQTRPQDQGGELEYAFAPLKQARLDYMAQKAAEMGVGRLIPVLTRRTQMRRVNCDRIRANVIEAAEQCGLLCLPSVAAPIELDRYLMLLSSGRRLIFCDENAPVADALAALRTAFPERASLKPSVSLLIGPEGGFDDEERRQILSKLGVIRLSLGPRILRADTAAVAALALVQAAIGDWR
jgi:16S rRNA (uracil1498-N3)-methyltransferase